MLFSSVTSTVRGITSPPVFAFISAAAFSRVSNFLLAIIRLAPYWLRPSAMASPRPPAPPITTAFFPFRLKISYIAKQLLQVIKMIWTRASHHGGQLVISSKNC
jgi:hypothetical protein